MDRCPKCNSRLNVMEGTYKSDVGSTDVYLVQNLVCSNKECDNCKDGIVLDTITHKLN